jgi:peptide/nickel transport system permease protein
VLTYLLRRWLALLPTLFLASVLVFAIISLAPGDPVRMRLGTEATPEEVANERQRMGLDRPVPVRYLIWLSDVVRLDLGRSQVNNLAVSTLIADALPNSLRLALTAFAVAVAIGVPLGCLAALRQNGRPDALITGLNSLGLAMPPFWLGMVLILLFSVTFQWLPPSGVGEPGRPWYLSLHYLVLPVTTLAIVNLSVISRFTRSAMIDVLGADYVRTARAKGVREPWVVARHALRTALLPVVTILGIQFGRLLGGAVVTETVFAYPGIGRLVVTSIFNRDYPVVQGTLMLVVVIFLLTSLVVDLSYAYLDPRVAVHRSG